MPADTAKVRQPRMMTTQQLNTDPDAYRVAIVASERLRDALARHGLAFPSLRGAFPTVTGGPYVELGGCSAAVVEQLAELLEAAAPAAKACG